ncbi:MAG: magnesium transporter [Acidobacteria bacterium]|nr:magnesium transporter [Acidobacteriota bacterium]
MLYLSELLGLPVYELSGKKIGKVVELAAVPAAPRPRIALLLVKDRKDRPPRSVSLHEITFRSAERIRLRVALELLPEFQPDEGLLLLRKDLLDQQIIDVHGRKVVRVNDLFLEERPVNRHTELLLSAVDIGFRGALRRLLIGVVPRAWLRLLENRIKPASIPWEFVDLIEPDPRRQLKLNISHRVLTKLHPADLADIMEELSPKERQAVFAALDDATVAEVLSEIKPKLRASILESLGLARAAGIIEEMEPDSAADLLADLPEETATELLQDMNREEAAELGELLEFPENSAGGLMTTDYVAIPASASVEAARNLIASLPELPDNLTTLFLVDIGGKLVGSVPLGRLIAATPKTALLELRLEPPLSLPVDSPETDVVELFDKYNLLSLPIVDPEQHLIGAVTVDDIISILRKKG